MNYKFKFAYNDFGAKGKVTLRCDNEKVYDIALRNLMNGIRREIDRINKHGYYGER